VTLIYEAGRQYITNGSGQIVFDTNERLFTATTFVQGSKALSAYSVSPGGELEVNATTTLASVPSGCNVAVGMMRIDSGAWTVANGTHLDSFKYGGPHGANWRYWWYVRGVRALTFFVESGSLKVNERTLMCPSSANDGINYYVYVVPAATLYYQLFVGSFV
jgi:hypothetical protein